VGEMRTPEAPPGRSGPPGLPEWLRLSPVALIALVVLSGAAAFVVVAVTVGDAEPGTEATGAGYFGTIHGLLSEAGTDIAALAPMAVLESCRAGEEAACAAQSANATAVIDRLAALSDAVGANTPPFRAVVWHSAYLDALGELRSALRLQVEAIAARDPEAFAAAVSATEAAVRAEEGLVAQFNREFADQFR